MSQGVENVIVSTIIGFFTALVIFLLVFFIGNHDTKASNDYRQSSVTRSQTEQRLGTACIQAGNYWINNNCLPTKP